MVKLEDIKVNSAAIEHGEWIGARHGTPIPDMGELGLKVRGVDSAAARLLRQKLVAALPRFETRGGTVSDEAQSRISAQVLADAILLDWEGIERGDGPLPFTAEEARRILENPDYVKLKSAVIWASMQVGDYSRATKAEG